MNWLVKNVHHDFVKAVIFGGSLVTKFEVIIVKQDKSLNRRSVPIGYYLWDQLRILKLVPNRGGAWKVEVAPECGDSC